MLFRSPTESHYRTVSLARDLAASTAPQHIRKRYTLRNYESDSESSVQDSICFLPYNMSCPTHNISGPRCALSYVNYLHGAITRLIVPPSDASPYVPPDASMELQRYNARKRGIAFQNAPAQGDNKRQDTSSSSSSSLSDHLILSRYVCSNIVANIVSNIYMYVVQHVRTFVSTHADMITCTRTHVLTHVSAYSFMHTYTHVLTHVRT